MSEQVDTQLDVDEVDLDATPDAGDHDDGEFDSDGAARADDGPEVPAEVAADAEIAVVGDGDTEVLCPGCGLTLVGSSPRPSAEWFCPRCDYPLFWASEPDPDAPPASRASRRRLPGSGGRIRPGAEPCWHCGELDEPGDTECRRCAATLPKPLAPVVEIEREVPVPVPVLVRPVMWPFVAAGTSGGIAIAIAVTIWLTGGGA